MNGEFMRTIQEINNEILVSNTTYEFQRKAKLFIKEAFSANSNEIDWIHFCNVAEKLSARPYALLFLCSALRRGLSFGEYTMVLNEKKDLFDELARQQNCHSHRVFCGANITKLIVYARKSNDSGYLYLYVNTNNKFLVKLLQKCLSNWQEIGIHINKKAVFHFANSFGEYEEKIASLEHLSCRMIFKQAEYYKRLFSNEPQLLDAALTFLCYFYRWLVDKNPGCDFFCSEHKISKSLLFSPRLKTYLAKEYYFTTFNPANIPTEYSKIVFLANGFDRTSTRFLAEDYFTVDLSGVSSQEYRKLMLTYIVTSGSIHGALQYFSFNTGIMELLYKTKQENGYSNPNLFHLSASEALFIKTHCDALNYATTTKSNCLGSLKRFFNWCKKSGLIYFEPLFFENLGGYSEIRNAKAKAIPDAELIKINNYLYENSKASLKNQLIYAIFHLALQTEFRISQICSLRIDAIKPTVKPRQYILRANTKTSYGDTIECVITEMTYRILKEIIEKTESLRNGSGRLDLKKYIFIYQGNKIKSATVMTIGIFDKALKNACEELHINKYSPSNLRDTHMTKSLEYIIRNGKSSLELSLLSKHKHIDTTINHYVDLELEKMLEATYGVEIGKNYIDTNDKIVKDLPHELSGPSSDVEFGCGKCKAKSCDGTAALSCLVCENFVTTIKHAPQFEKAIESIQQRILNTENRHEKEDLNTIKTLLVLYLKAIYAHKEDTNE